MQPSYVDEDLAKESLLNEGADPLLISKEFSRIKINKGKQKNPDELVLGADSVISLDRVNKQTKDKR